MINIYLEILRDKKGSDLFLSANCKPLIKIEGNLHEIGEEVLSADSVKSAALGIMSEIQVKKFEEELDLDFAFELPDGSARFRVNVFFQRGEWGLVFRLIPSSIPNLSELDVPEVLSELMTNRRGLILMVGGTGSGKSTTLAAMINHRNENFGGHILTIEDPIEFSHKSLKSIVNQREVGVDTKSYHAALRSAMREAPDVIMIGEIRDRETMETTMELCNTGHLAISTMHANNANQAIERIVNLYPQNLHKQLFMDLSLNMRAVISQRLIKGSESRRVAAVEVLLNTPHIADLILQGAIGDIKEAMESTGQKGAQTFDNALYDLFKADKISMEEALGNADSRANLETKINFG